MANKVARAHVKSVEPCRERLLQQVPDASVLPVAQLAQLHRFRPDLVDFIVAETQREAEHRRKLESRGYWLLFIERIFGQVCAVLVAALGMGGSVYLGMHGQPVLGGTIATVMIASLAVAFIVSKKSRMQQSSGRKA